MVRRPLGPRPRRKREEQQPLAREGGGIGRRAGFRFQWGNSCTGSTPVLRTVVSRTSDPVGPTHRSMPSRSRTAASGPPRNAARRDPCPARMSRRSRADHRSPAATPDRAPRRLLLRASSSSCISDLAPDACSPCSLHLVPQFPLGPRRLTARRVVAHDAHGVLFGEAEVRHEDARHERPRGTVQRHHRAPRRARATSAAYTSFGSSAVGRCSSDRAASASTSARRSDRLA